MELVSIQTVVFLFASLIAFHLAPSLAVRRLVLLVSNAVFVAFVVARPRTAVPTALFLLGSFLLVRLVQLRPRRDVTALSIAAIVTAFVYLKQYALPLPWRPLPFPYSVVGLSYVLFRVVHLIVECHDRALRAPVTAIDFFNYCCFFPSWLSGPIQSYREYAAQERAPSSPAVDAVLSRIVTGCFKIACVSALLLDVHGRLVALRLDAAQASHFVAVLAAAAACWALYMYYNFAGYMDVVIGIGRFYGFQLPENFDRPFAAGNFLEFWTRWHITLSNWFKVYVFNPGLRALASRVETPRAMPYLGVVAYFVTFLLMGVWHGSTRAFVIYGLLLGAGVSANKLYEIVATTSLGKARFRALRANRLYAGTCRGAVFGYFACALVCLWASPALGQEVGRHPALALETFVVLTAAAGVVLALGSAVAASSASVVARWRSLTERRLPARLVLGEKIYAVALLVVMKTIAVPAFVYVRF